MGALTDSVVFRGVQVRSGDVLAFAPRGLARLWRRPFLAIVDARDRSIPYLVVRKGTRVHKIPLLGAPYRLRAWHAEAWRHPRVDTAKGGVIAGKAAERPGEGIHHPKYDCGRDVESDVALVREAYAAAGIEVAQDGGTLGEPFARVAAGPVVANAAYRARSQPFIDRGIDKTLPWQKRTRR